MSTYSDFLTSTYKNHVDEICTLEKRVLMINDSILKISKKQKTSKDDPTKTLIVVAPREFSLTPENKKIDNLKIIVTRDPAGIVPDYMIIDPTCDRDLLNEKVYPISCRLSVETHFVRP